MNTRPDDATGDEDDEPTRDLTGGEEPETASLPPDTGEATGQLEPETGQTEEMRTRRLAADGPESTPPPTKGEPGSDSRSRGIRVLAASIAAALVLTGVYIAAGGLDYEPAAASDPCDARKWEDTTNLEETAQQFGLSALDGTACDLDVSREELIRALADGGSLEAFAEEQGLSDQEVETAIRSGLNRAIDEGESAGAIGGLEATGLRAAVKILPASALVGLIENASGLLEGSQVGELGDVIDGVIGSLGGESSGDGGGSGSSGDSGSSITDGLDQLEQDLREQLPPSVEKNIPDDIQNQIQDQLDGLLSP